MSTVSRRERERDNGGRTFTTVRRYRVPDREEDGVVERKEVIIRRSEREPPRETRSDHRSERGSDRDRDTGRRETDYRIIEREREITREEPPPRRELDYRTFERERERERERSPPSRDYRYERDIVRVPSPPPIETRIREFRYERDVERSPPRREFTLPREREPAELERYVRSTEYYAQPPIIIRQDPQPIIIQEAPRQPIVLQRDRDRDRDESRYEPYAREEVREDNRSLVRREEPPREEPRREEPRPQEPPPPSQPRRDGEDYYYERTTREVDRGPRRGGDGGAANEEYHDREYRSRREVDPRESASQYGDDRYSSDSDRVVVRKERIVERSRSGSPAHRRHLAEGAIAGIGAAELLRHHKKRQGEEPGHRGRQLVGSAALGAVGAEVLSRARSRGRSMAASRSRSRSYSRSVSSERSYRARARSRRRKHRSKSRSRSKSRVRQLGGLAAIAAVGAVAGYALRNRGNNQPAMIEARRSRSRRRRGSLESVEYIEEPIEMPADPKARNNRMAQAGLASAAAAGIWQRMRSRSRGAKGAKSRSQSRLRTGATVAGAGLGGAALAGLYERKKAKKEGVPVDAPRRMSRSLSRSRSRSRSYSRSRSRSVPYPEDPGMRRAASDAALIEYGGDPIHSDRRYDEPGEYRRRHRGSSSSSPDSRIRRPSRSRSRSRSKSRRRGLAEAAAAAGVAGAAAHGITKRNERKRAERERRRREEESENERYGRDHSPRYSPPPMGANAGNYPSEQQQQEFYPSSNQFPPPPTNDYGARNAEYQPGEYAPYNPADYPPPPGATPQPGMHEQYQQYPMSPDGHAHMNDPYAGDPHYEGGHAAGRSGPENMA